MLYFLTDHRYRNFFQRALTTIFLLLLVGLACVVPYVMSVLGVFLACFVLYELTRLSESDFPAGVLIVQAIGFVVFVHSTEVFWLYCSTAVLLLWFFLFFLLQKNSFFLEKYAHWRGIEILYAATVMLALAGLEQAPYLLLLAIVPAICQDLGGYVIGKKFGRRRLWPAISPNKTFEGFLGGVFFSFLGYLLVVGVTNVSVEWTLLYFVVAIPFAVYGDLSISWLKRRKNMSDVSHLLPGHGGLLDRLDSHFPVWLLLIVLYNWGFLAFSA